MISGQKANAILLDKGKVKSQTTEAGSRKEWKGLDSRAGELRSSSYKVGTREITVMIGEKVANERSETRHVRMLQSEGVRG